MTPTHTQKAKELVRSFYIVIYGGDNDFEFSLLNRLPAFKDAKQCALIAVDEILQTGMLLDDMQAFMSNHTPNQTFKYWQAVRAEIEKL